jgi:hypothetical protein
MIRGTAQEIKDILLHCGQTMEYQLGLVPASMAFYCPAPLIVRHTKVDRLMLIGCYPL